MLANAGFPKVASMRGGIRAWNGLIAEGPPEAGMAISVAGWRQAWPGAAVLLAGLAEDGGLFLPETWPHFSPADWRALRGRPYPEIAARVMQPFVGGPFAREPKWWSFGWGRGDLLPRTDLESGD